MKLAAFVPLLLARFPDAAFTTDSLEFVAARAVKGFPTYAELVAWLGEWWRDNRPSPPRLPYEPPQRVVREPLTPEQLEHIRRITAETVAFLRSSAQPESERRPPGPRYLTPAQLDQVNPLPGGVKRHVETADVSPATDDTLAASEDGAAASLDPDTAAAA
jgi:hypothetical protein